MKKLLKKFLPNDCSRQFNAFEMISHNYGSIIEKQDNWKILDLGAGNGDSYDKLKLILENISYIGLDIEESPEVLSRTRNDITFEVYDGINMPFKDQSFDIIFCKQVLEHVRYPDDVIKEVHRVLKPNGYFVGSVSFLEPYHSYSIFNWSPYGIYKVFTDNNIRLIELRPGIDGVTMIFRRLFNPDKFNFFFRIESLFNHYLESKLEKNPSFSKNWEKLIVSGHICYLAQKEVSSPKSL